MFDFTSPPDLWSQPKNPYYLFCPDYRETSSGVFALHQLCHALNLSGMEAYVTAVKRNPRMRTPLLTTAIEQAHVAAGQVPITIYPEVVTGNPRKEPVVVRYILNRPGHLGGEAEYPASELLFAFSPEFLPPGVRADILFAPLFDLGLFRPDGREPRHRVGRYFFAQRFRERGGALQDATRGCLELSFSAPLSLPQLAGIFRSAEVLFSYERSAICTEAMLCGCPVVYLPSEHMTEFPTTDSIGKDGAAWGTSPEEWDRARATVGRVRERLLELQAGFWGQLRHFVAVTQRAAGAYSVSRAPAAEAAAGPFQARVVRSGM